MTEAGDRNDVVSGIELREVMLRRLLWAAMLANGGGAVVVFVFASFLFPTTLSDEEAEGLILRSAIVTAVYLAITLPLGAAWARRRGRPIRHWLESGRPATAAERGLVVRFSLTSVVVSAPLWGFAAVLFTLVNASAGFEVAITIGVVVALGGVTSCALAYLLTERSMRPVVARALAGGPPPELAAPGVATRLTMAWVLATGVALLGVAALAVSWLAGADLDTRSLLGSIVFLAGVALVVGLPAIVFAARSVAEPVAAVRAAAERLERGDLDARVEVEDGSEVGLLQAGFNRMAAGLEERERLRDLFGRHVGRDVARAALDAEVTLGGELREVAALFVDVVGSTALAARRPPEEVVTVLNEFFAIVVEVVERHGGWVNKFEGDAALCVFGAPTARDDPAGDALRSARTLGTRLHAELPDVEAGIGVSAGEAVAGNVGAEQRIEYTVIGDPINEAARLCELAKTQPGRVVASDAALDRAASGEAEHWTLGEAVTLRGRASETRLATVAG